MTKGTHYKIARELLLKLAPEKRGDTVRYNHTDCPAGEDRRQRLYVTRTQEDAVLGYCHNCSGRGFAKTDGYVQNIHTFSHYTHYTPSSATRYAVLDDVFQDYHYVNELGTQHHSVDSYLKMYQLNPEYVFKDKWSWGTDRSGDIRLIWPFFNGADGLTGYQARLIWREGDPRVMKQVLTYGQIGLHIFNPNDSEILVICEDRTSGVRIAQAGFSAAVLHGSRQITAEEAHKLTMMFDQFVVWYDNDNTAVCMNAEGTLATLQLFTDRAAIVTKDPTDPLKQDPKNYCEDDIINRVTGRLDARYCAT